MLKGRMLVVQAGQGKLGKKAATIVSCLSDLRKGSEHRCDRIKRFDRLICSQESQGVVEVERVSSGRDSFNPTRIRTLTIVDWLTFCQQANEVLKGDADASKPIDKGKLCAGARETMRYLAILPQDRDSDGKHDWSTLRFCFDEQVRNARLEKARRNEVLRVHQASPDKKGKRLVSRKACKN